ncbi:MAG TPA: glycosyltransferase family 4 protein [Candidatus Hydrogenedentes bacterium]|nr:glycosyltransferase family 4 protein [Candidatus Hydrogenedentota bacterium]
MRVAIAGACPYPVPQGSQVLLRDTALALHDRGHDVHLVVYGYGEGVDESGLRIHRSAHVAGGHHTKAGPTLAKPFLDLALVSKLRNVVRAERIDVVQAHNYEGLLVALAARVAPVVYQAHNAMADELPHYAGFGFLGKRIGSWLDHTFPRRAAQVVVPHVAIALYLIACGCAPGKVSVIAPPASTHWFAPAVASGQHPPIVYTGNLDAYQNIEFLEHVMARVRAEAPDARLVLATRDHTVMHGAELHYTPDFATLRAVLAQDAVVVCPRVSWSGYPIKLLNAMAAGKAVVACRSAAHPLEHEVTGIVVDDNDEEAFASAVVRLMQSPALRDALGKQARQVVDTNHTPKKFAEALESVFERALARA